MIPRLLVAGTGSGVGKTLMTAGLIGALRRRGMVVQPFKCGPDYIDPGWHGRAAGRPCRNLDTWMLGEDAVRASFQRGCAGADIAVIEGVMGLFDGARFDSSAGSAAEIAALLGAPVLLVLDISGSARSAAAVALGFARFDPARPVAGVALNFAGSERHALGCGAAITEMTGLKMFGWLPRAAGMAVPERHLGLKLAEESGDADAVLAAAADAVAARFDLDGLLELAAGAPAMPGVAPVLPVLAGDGPVLAVAQDAAFSFYYQDDFDLLAAAGVRLVRFSPVAGERLPEGVAGVYLGGGYPELHAAALAANAGLWQDLRALHAQGGLILAECGGFMVLTEALIDTDGVRHGMAGLIPGVTRMTTRLAALGYREATALCDTPLAACGEVLRGHEFHYSVWDRAEAPPAPAWRAVGTRAGMVPAMVGHADRGLVASYLHIPLAQRPDLAGRLVRFLSGIQGPPALGGGPGGEASWRDRAAKRTDGSAPRWRR
ncbi:Cobyrinate a,c-diamide synthase [Rhodovastum atsumiense]|uniref:Cobyrinate a,c-diamide synthase n=1 Tax=Rhodovastum atsumiense TaxID=504468 RepID=A0A5M6IWW8_9PROT|nr:cobyrinate a,c-diamide synthase [Rhodovastum atsumiense]KAA5612824.1 cobyrinate a,c-diamide synthase [Rhodovastum atsumiense]CAH2601111.1 Cobyrinate a,c-diamide synthase [Rhodovastum atsumiense]